MDLKTQILDRDVDSIFAFVVYLSSIQWIVLAVLAMNGTPAVETNLGVCCGNQVLDNG